MKINSVYKDKTMKNFKLKSSIVFRTLCVTLLLAPFTLAKVSNAAIGRTVTQKLENFVSNPNDGKSAKVCIDELTSYIDTNLSQVTDPANKSKYQTLSKGLNDLKDSKSHMAFVSWFISNMKKMPSDVELSSIAKKHNPFAILNAVRKRVNKN